MHYLEGVQVAGANSKVVVMIDGYFIDIFDVMQEKATCVRGGCTNEAVQDDEYCPDHLSQP